MWLWGCPSIQLGSRPFISLSPPIDGSKRESRRHQETNHAKWISANQAAHAANSVGQTSNVGGRALQLHRRGHAAVKLHRPDCSNTHTRQCPARWAGGWQAHTGTSAGTALQSKPTRVGRKTHNLTTFQISQTDRLITFLQHAAFHQGKGQTQVRLQVCSQVEDCELHLALSDTGGLSTKPS